MPRNSSKLFRRFDNKTAFRLLYLNFDEVLDFRFQYRQFRKGKSDFRLATHRPDQRAIEGRGSKIRSEKGNRTQSKNSRRLYCGAKRVVICFLDRATCADLNIVAESPEREDSRLNKCKGTFDSSNSVMNFGRPIQRNNHVIEALRNSRG